MKQQILLFTFFIASLCAVGQTSNEVYLTPQNEQPTLSKKGRNLFEKDRNKFEQHPTLLRADSLQTDSVENEVDEYPWYLTPYLGSYDWFLMPLHQGLNASVSMSATVGLGGGHPSGVGFGREINLVYASPLGKQLSYTLNVNTSSLDWGGYHANQSGVGGTLNYLLNDRVSFTLAGYKDLVHPRSLWPVYGPRRDHYVGGAVNMKLTDFFYIQVSVGASSWR